MWPWPLTSIKTEIMPGLITNVCSGKYFLNYIRKQIGNLRNWWKNVPEKSYLTLTCDLNHEWQWLWEVQWGMHLWKNTFSLIKNKDRDEKKQLENVKNGCATLKLLSIWPPAMMYIRSNFEDQFGRSRNILMNNFMRSTTKYHVCAWKHLDIARGYFASAWCIFIPSVISTQRAPLLWSFTS